MVGQETSWSQPLLLIAFRKQCVCFKYNMNVLFAGRSDTLCMQTALQSYITYLTIIPQVRMGYELIAHEAKGRMGY